MPDKETEAAKKYLYREISTNWDNKVDRNGEVLRYGADRNDNGEVTKTEFFTTFDRQVRPKLENNGENGQRRIDNIEHAAAKAFRNGGVLTREEWLVRNQVRIPQEAIDKAALLAKEAEPLVKQRWELTKEVGALAIQGLEAGARATGDAIQKAPEVSRKLDKNNNGLSFDEIGEGLHDWWYGKPKSPTELHNQNKQQKQK